MRWRRDERDQPDVDVDVDAPAATPGPPAHRPTVPVELGRVPGDQLRQAQRRVVARALTEDLAGATDLTSALTVPVGTRGRALVVAREDGVVAGLGLVAEVCSQVDHRLQVTLRHFDGDVVMRGAVVAEVSGPLRTLLTAERTALNLVCRLSGIATRTRQFADVLDGTDCVVRDTRKTTPGMRLLEKHAVAVGGGANHRIGLYDAILVKDNHVAAAGGVGPAARAALAGAPDGVHVQVEVTTIPQAEAAIAEGVTDLLLDNFTPEGLREAVTAIDGRAAVEASGGITLETARSFAEAGADRLAVGALTHSAPALDLAMDVVEVDPPSTSTVRPATRRTAASGAVDAGGDVAADTRADAPATDDADRPSDVDADDRTHHPDDGSHDRSGADGHGDHADAGTSTGPAPDADADAAPEPDADPDGDATPSEDDWGTTAPLFTDS